VKVESGEHHPHRSLDTILGLISQAGLSPRVTNRASEIFRRLGEAEARMFDVLVHATPVGMFPRAHQCFFEDRIPAKMVMDMVYNPLETLLLRRAREQGAEVISGLEMFLEQAVRQFEIWTGKPAPAGDMLRAVTIALQDRAAAQKHEKS